MVLPGVKSGNTCAAAPLHGPGFLKWSHCSFFLLPPPPSLLAEDVADVIPVPLGPFLPVAPRVLPRAVGPSGLEPACLPSSVVVAQALREERGWTGGREGGGGGVKKRHRARRYEKYSTATAARGCAPDSHGMLQHSIVSLQYGCQTVVRLASSSTASNHSSTTAHSGE